MARKLLRTDYLLTQALHPEVYEKMANRYTLEFHGITVKKQAIVNGEAIMLGHNSIGPFTYNNLNEQMLVGMEEELAKLSIMLADMGRAKLSAKTQVTHKG